MPELENFKIKLKKDLYNYFSDIDSVFKKKTIILFPENKKIEYKPEDNDLYIYIPSLNIYFLKTNQNLLEIDCITKNFIYINKEIIKKELGLNLHLITVYNNIDDNLNFIEFGKTINVFDYNFIEIKKSGLIYNFTLEILDNPIFKENFVENMKNGIFYEKKSIIDDKILEKDKFTKYRKHKNSFNFKKFIEYKPNTYSKLNGKEYTFGVEIETSSGFLPKRLDSQLCYSAVHDGSLKDEETGECIGGEYVTDVLYGDMGLKQLKMLSTELSKRCFVNNKCGNHIHIGNIIPNKENVILMYNLYQKIEDEIFSILPYSRRNNEYCRKLKYIDINLDNLNKHKTYYTEYYYNQIILLMTKNLSNSKLVNKKQDHPKGFKCGYDHSSERYCWVNFIPLLFDTRKTSYEIDGLRGHYTNPVQTIEFRPMQGTTDYFKLKSWLLIYIALVDIVENHKDYIYNNSDNYKLTSIINTCYSKTKISNDLNEYIELCKEKYKIKSIKLENQEYLEYNIDENYLIKNL